MNTGKNVTNAVPPVIKISAPNERGQFKIEFDQVMSFKFHTKRLLQGEP